MQKFSIAWAIIGKGNVRNTEAASIKKEEKKMRKVRKGFTLVELLIVVAILATLTASMTMAVSGSTAKAKAATIASNVSACRNAAMTYAVTYGTDGIDELTADDVLFDALPSWKDFANDNNNIKYAADLTSGTAKDGKGRDNWAITVDFSKDPEKDTVVEELQKINGYNNSYKNATDTGTAIISKSTTNNGKTTAGKYKFKVTLLSGKIEAAK